MAGKRVYGTLFKKGSTTQAEITAINDAGPEADMLDVTSLDSASGTREFIAGLINSGEFSVELNFVVANATHATMQSDLKAGTSGTYSIVWTGAAETWTFTALVKSFKVGGAVGDKLTGNAAFQISGVITVS